MLVVNKYKLLISCLERLRANWHSPVYGFFKSKVVIDYDDSRKFHFFQCAAKCCKGKVKGVHRYQDSQDRAATSNLKTHATKCFGTDAVKAAFNWTPSTSHENSIFAMFACLGQKAVSFSHRAHTSDESRCAVHSSHSVDWPGTDWGLIGLILHNGALKATDPWTLSKIDSLRFLWKLAGRVLQYRVLQLLHEMSSWCSRGQGSELIES